MAYSGPGKTSAVDAILAEAADLVALEQIAKLNTALLADDSALPSDLESRFRKLKSLPAAAPAPVKTLGRSVTAPHATTTTLDPPQRSPTTPQKPSAPTPTAAQEEQRPGPGQDASGKKENSPPHPPVTAVSAVIHDDDDDEEEGLERLFGGSGGGGRGRLMLRERNRGKDEDEDGSTSPPPPRQACCFGFSPNKKPLQRTLTKKSKKKVHESAGGGTDRDILGIDADEWGDENMRMVTELKEQQRKLKKALEEQEKVSRETAKMARWVKQASARMTHTAAIDDLLSDSSFQRSPSFPFFMAFTFGSLFLSFSPKVLHSP